MYYTPMAESLFEFVTEALRESGPSCAFDVLARRFLADKNFAAVFETRMMAKRHELALPLVQIGSLDDVPADKRPEYEKAFMAAAREVGSLFLADGDIPRAWSYFRAIGEPAPVADAIEKLSPDDITDGAIEIALYEHVNPKRGFEFLLAKHGLCRAITVFGQYQGREARADSLRLLVRTLYHDLSESLKRTVAEVEGKIPDRTGVRDLITGRDWLFEGMNYYVDTSHLASILQYSVELEDPEDLRQAIEMTEYGDKLAPMFHYKGDPPFENIYVDYGIFLRALAGENTDAAIAHFRKKASDADPEDPAGAAAAQVLVMLLGRRKRYGEAIEVSLEFLQGIEPNQLACPSVLQLCELAGDYSRMMRIAEEKGDLLNFAAGAVGATSLTPSR
jgi:hypothetical protein